MTVFIAWIIAASLVISDNKASVSNEFAGALANELTVNPLTKDPKFDALVFVETAWHEANFRNDRDGDAGQSVCTLQVLIIDKTIDGWSRKEVKEDPYKCIHSAMHIMKYSFKICPQHPLAPYASGTCTNKAGIAISDLRMWEVRKAQQKMNSIFIELNQDF